MYYLRPNFPPTGHKEFMVQFVTTIAGFEEYNSFFYLTYSNALFDRMFRIKTLEFDNRPLFPPSGHKPFTDGSICNYNCMDLKNTTHSSETIQTCYLKPIVSRIKLTVHYFLS